MQFIPLIGVVLIPLSVHKVPLHLSKKNIKISLLNFKNSQL